MSESIPTPETAANQPVLGVVPPTQANPRVEVLREAATLIEGERQTEYGTPQVNFRRIADFWNTSFRHLLRDDVEFTPADVALAMTLVKIGRIVQTPKRDSFADAAGYIGLAYELSLEADSRESH